MVLARAVWWTLRVGAALCFIGHGAFGIITKEAWLPFFAMVGMGRDAAFVLMPVIGMVDIAVGISVLVAPRPAALLYMAVWSMWTAALRPLTGDSTFEMLERAGNYGVPMAMLLMCWPRKAREWLAAAVPRPFTPDLQQALRAALIVTTSLLLLGHGALGILEMPALTTHYMALGVAPASAVGTAQVVGWLEIGLVAALVWRPSASMALALVTWKMATESLWLVAGAPVWEFIERAGSYAAPLALALVIGVRRRGVAATHLAAMRTLVAMALLGASVPASAPAQARDSIPWQTRINQLDDRPLLAALRAGGLVLACRHAITEDDVNDQSSTDRSQQRNLSQEGRNQSIAIGRAVRKAGIGIGPVLSSPMYRTRETAELAFGDSAVEVNSLLRGQPPMSEIMRLFTQQPPDGKNRVLMTHQGTLYRILTMFRRPEIREGDCVALRPNARAGTFQVIAKLSLADWERLAKL